MEKIEGVLNELGQSTIGGGLVDYSYLVINNTHTRALRCGSGLSGKINLQLGKNIVIHFSKNRIFAITTDEGNSFFTNFKVHFFQKIIYWTTMIVLLPFCIFLVFIPFVAFSAYMLISINKTEKLTKEASLLPNAIGLDTA